MPCRLRFLQNFSSKQLPSLASKSAGYMLNVSRVHVPSRSPTLAHPKLLSNPLAVRGMLETHPAGCRWLSKGKEGKSGEREIKVAKPKGKKGKPSAKLASVATTKLYKKLEEECIADMIEVENVLDDPPHGWRMIDLEPHLGQGEQGLLMLQKQSKVETVSVLSSFQFVGSEDDFEDEEDGDETQAPSFVCLVVIEKNSSNQEPIFAQCVMEEDGPRIVQLSIGMGMPGGAHNAFGPFNYVYQTYAMISSRLKEHGGAEIAAELVEEGKQRMAGMTEEELQEQVRDFEQSLTKEDKDELASMQKFAREHMEKIARGEELTEEEVDSSPLNPDNNPFRGRLGGDVEKLEQLKQQGQHEMPPPPCFAPDINTLSPTLQRLLQQLVQSRLDRDVVEYLLQNLAMKEQACYAQFLHDTKNFVNPIP